MLQSKPELRPTLEEVQNHAFFTGADVRIPMSLPQSSTVEAPHWRINSRGEIVVDITRASTSSKSKTSSSSSSRQPLREKTNDARPKSSSQATKPSVLEADKENNVPTGRITRSRAKAAEKEGAGKEEKTEKKSSKWAFKIYDDYINSKEDKKKEKKAEKKTSAKDEGDADVDDLTAKTAAFTLSNGGASTASSSSRRSSAGSAIDNDMFALETMHQRLSQSFKSAPPSVQAEAPDAGATKWVTRYVDYTSKYGLGFLLNDGSAGVYFNDSTKIVLDTEGVTFQYIERKRTEGSEKRGEHVSETHTLEEYPSILQKKVILLKHFRNYLAEQHKRSEKKAGKDGKDEKDATAAPSGGAAGSGLVYLKKWVRTRHAILFRLSNRTVQVVFFDHTEVLLSCEARSVTYVDKERNRETNDLAEVMGGKRPDVQKRLKYTKDILHQLITGAKR